MSGALAALWLLGLFAAAPILRGNVAGAYTFVDRLRDALILGVAIPLVLAAVHLLFPAALWICLALCAGLRLVSHIVTPSPSTPLGTGSVEGPPGVTPYITIAAIALAAWPALMRPPLDGDTLSYHLPNAAAWVHAHSMWTTDPRYWWYPPASEAFAAALYAVSGPFAVGWSGLAALLLLGFRIAAWTRALGAPALLADALAAATVTAAPLALQGGTLQNDVWLTAFFLETLWSLRSNDASTAMRSCAIAALIKPYGCIFALVAAAFGRAPARVWLAAAAAIALWAGHDAMLWNHAIVSPASASTANSWSTSILAHGLPGLALLVQVLFLASPFALVALVAAFAGPALTDRTTRGTGWAAFAVALALLLMPLAYADFHPQLATGESLRFAAPAIALGAVLLARPATRTAAIATAALLASTLFGAYVTLGIFWNDAPTRSALGIAVIAVAIAYVARRLHSPWPIVAGFAIATMASTILAARQPADYYADALTVNGVRSGVYAWIAATQPPVVGGWGLRLGTINVLSPQTRTLDLPDDAACDAARTNDALLVAVAEADRTAVFNADRLRVARTCGATLYVDGGSAAMRPEPRRL